MGQVREAAGPARHIDFSQDDNLPFVGHQVVELTWLVLAVRSHNKRVKIFVWAVPPVLVDADADGKCGHRM